ncbi:MAG: hypothetical protein HN929_12945, partial [Chloroflexi bacterium]|nr:hypothetical protein [Chloroflexota bacterium]
MMTKEKKILQIVLTIIGALFFHTHIMAMPSVPSVESGSAGISQDGNTMTVDQQTDKAIIDWQDYSIAAD